MGLDLVCVFRKKKPPLGIMPRHLWIEQRIQGLFEAIKRADKSSSLVEQWHGEIEALFYDLLATYAKG